jgi:hypothetical protein
LSQFANWKVTVFSDIKSSNYTNVPWLPWKKFNHLCTPCGSLLNKWLGVSILFTSQILLVFRDGGPHIIWFPESARVAMEDWQAKRSSPMPNWQFTWAYHDKATITIS